MKEQLIQALVKISSKSKITNKDLHIVDAIKDLIKMEINREMWSEDKYVDAAVTLSLSQENSIN